MKQILQETFEKHVKLVRNHFNLNENNIFEGDDSVLQQINNYIKNGMKGELDISGTSIEKLPDTLTHVGGDLHAYYCENLKSLGGLEKVDGDLSIEHTPIEELPDTLKHVGGDLGISNTSIKILPDTLTYVGGELDAHNCKNLTSLGGLEHTSRHLDIRNTSIEELPDTLKRVRGHIFTTNENLIVPDHLKGKVKLVNQN